ncbi:HIT domain-containing protein [Actinoallomurus sp. NPDC052274]|uniref:HIT family protein n=1 Tax=Actinoallomurus sp. NPDC052274 TaxID=3155420 RepID=UPI003436CF74
MRCVFCELLKSGTARWVTRQSSVAAFAPLRPLAPGHTLVIPTEHYADIFDTPPGPLADAMALVQHLAMAMRTALDASGVNVLHASGPGSEQSVPHLHFHVVPRWPDDRFSTWPAGQSHHHIPADPIAQLAEALRPHEQAASIDDVRPAAARSPVPGSARGR